MFQVSFIAGGTIDKIRELPHPHFSKFTKPYIKGRKLLVVNRKDVFSDAHNILFDAEFLSIAVASNVYSTEDYWELTIGEEKICETIYTKELPESVSMGNSFGIVYPVAANTRIKFDFHNVSGITKQVWYNLKFLR